MSTKIMVGAATIVVFFVAVIIAMLITEPVAQDIAYHNFSETDAFLGVQNFANVVSNLPFILVGVLGVAMLRRRSVYPLHIINGNIACYQIMTFGMVLVGLGSAYYHANPNNATLVWDRLPMTLVFMSLFAAVLGEFVNARLGIKLLPLLLAIGAFSVGYWWYTELHGKGDLRLYLMVQFVPMFSIPIITLLFEDRLALKSAYWQLFGCYLAAKVVEYYDSAIYATTGVIGGHSLKHALAAVGLYLLLRGYQGKLTPVGGTHNE